MDNSARSVEQVGAFAPKKRMMVLVNWCSIEDNGQVEDYADHFEVVGIAVRLVDEHLSPTCLIVVDGVLTTLEDAVRSGTWGDEPVVRTFVCDWKRCHDSVFLDDEMKQMTATARERRGMN